MELRALLLSKTDEARIATELFDSIIILPSSYYHYHMLILCPLVTSFIVSFLNQPHPPDASLAHNASFCSHQYVLQLDTRTGAMVAVKKAGLGRSGIEPSVYAEMRSLQEVSHPNVIQVCS